MAGAVVQSGLNMCATKLYDYCIGVSVGATSGAAGPCEADNTYIGVAAAGYVFNWNSPTGDKLIADLSTDLQTVIKSDATYQFTKLQIRGEHASAFQTGTLIAELQRSVALQFDYGGKIILQTLEIEFGL